MQLKHDKICLIKSHIPVRNRWHISVWTPNTIFIFSRFFFIEFKILQPSKYGKYLCYLAAGKQKHIIFRRILKFLALRWSKLQKFDVDFWKAFFCFSILRWSKWHFFGIPRTKLDKTDSLCWTRLCWSLKSVVFGRECEAFYVWCLS